MTAASPEAIMAVMLACVKDGSVRAQILKDGEWLLLTKEQWADFELRQPDGTSFKVSSPTYGDVAIRVFVEDMKKVLPTSNQVQ